MRRERPDHTLQPTALVHEAYLRLAGVRDAPVALYLAAGLVAAGLLALVAKGRLDSISGATLASLSGALLVGGSVANLGLPLALLALGGLGEGGDEGPPR